MAYRPTERTEARRTATRERIVGAALELVAEGGYRAASISALAERAGVATGSLYRHFPSKAELFTEVFRRASQREVDATIAAAAGPGSPLERVAAGAETFARRALRGRRLAWALLAEPVDPAVETVRLEFRRAYRDAFAATLREGVANGALPPQDPDLTAAALVGAIGEALVGPLAPVAAHDAPTQTEEDALVSALVRFCIRSITEEELSDVDRRQPVAA